MSINQAALRYGLWLGLAEVIYGIFFRVAGFHHQSPWGWAFYAMLPAAVWVALAGCRRHAPGLSYVGGVRLGTTTVALGAAIYCLQVWAYNRFVDDALLTEVRTTQLARLRASAADPAAIAAASSRLDVLLQPAAFALAVWVQLTVAGVVAALVIAAFARGRPARGEAVPADGASPGVPHAGD